MRVALILGAGWSAAAGYPLAHDLLRGTIYVGTEESRLRVQAVLDAYDRWLRERPDAAWAEPFLAAVRGGEILVPPDPDDPSLFDDGGGRTLPWTWAVEAVMLKLTWPERVRDGGKGRAELLPSRGDFRKRYGGHLESPVRAAEHQAFIRAILAEHEVVGVVTTNYDTLAEGVLRHRQIARDPSPGFHYGGLGPEQWAQGASSWDYYNEPEPEKNAIEITGAIPLCKIHGSLNWERGGNRIVIWRDMRLPYRDAGSAEIVAPTPEKDPEPWLAPVWETAQDVLSAAEHWIVVGYSAPSYDLAVRALLQTAARRGSLTSVDLHDIASDALRPRWEDITGVPVAARAGIPSESAQARAINRLTFFYGINVYMPMPPAPGEHPHFRASYQSSRASLGIPALTVIDGALPERALGLVREWASANQDALARNWTRAQANQAPELIAPLE